MFITTEQACIAVSDSGGPGFPIVLLHGSASSKDVFARQLQSELAVQFRLIALDLPGHGESSDASQPTRDYTIVGLAAAVREALQQLSIRRAVFFGWSLGGHVAIEVAGTSTLVAGLMLTGTPPVGHGPLAMLRGFQTSWDMLLAGKEEFSERDIDRFAGLCFEDSAVPRFRLAIARADGRLRPVFQRSMMRGEGVDQRATVEALDVPVAIVNGAREPFARLGYLPTLRYRALWHDACVVINDAGHAPFWQRPEAFNALLGQFAADVAAHEVAEPQRRARSA